MITNVKMVGIYVRDQERARDFYRDKLGFEVRTDQPFGEGLRWIEVAPPGAQTSLTLFTPQGMEDRIGTFANVIFHSPDVRATYEELRARGVEFTQPPTEQPWGTMAQFTDADGNTFVLSSS